MAFPLLLLKLNGSGFCKSRAHKAALKALYGSVSKPFIVFTVQTDQLEEEHKRREEETTTLSTQLADKAKECKYPLTFHNQNHNISDHVYQVICTSLYR